VDTRGGSQDGCLEPASDHRGGAERFDGEVGQPADPPAEHVLNRGRRVLLGQQGAEVAARAGESGELDDEERVAVRALAQGRGLRSRRPAPDHLLGHLGCLLGLQAAELEHHGVPACRRLREVGESSGRLGMGPPGRDHEQPLVAQGIDEHPQRAEARGIGPVQVLQHEHQRLLAGGPAHRGGDLLPDAEASGLLAGGFDRRQAEPKLAQSGRPGPVRRRALVLRAAAHHRPPRSPAGPLRQLGGQPALADARLADEGGVGRGSAVDRVQERLQRRQLVLTADDLTGPGADGDHGRRRRRALRRDRCRDGVVHGRLGPRESRVLSQHRRLQVTQFDAGLEAELVGEHGAHRGECLQSIRLAAGTGQRNGAEAPQPLAERMGRRERLELGRDGRVVPEGQRGHSPVLDRHEAQVVEPGTLGHRGRSVLQLGVRTAAPQVDGFVERVHGVHQGLARQPDRPEERGTCEQPVLGAHRGCEPPGVGRLRGQPEGIAGRDGHQHLGGTPPLAVRLQDAAEVRDVALQRARNARWRLLSPEHVDDGVHGDGPAQREREGAEQRPLLGCPEIHVRIGKPRLDGAEDQDLHPRSIGVLRSVHPANRRVPAAPSRRAEVPGSKSPPSQSPVPRRTV